MKEYRQLTLSGEKITDEDIFDARTDYELERRRRDPNYTGLPLSATLGFNMQ